ncbi:MAG: hypothetical protein EBV03_07600, partial [Proteobacteria bacterium]|nr:hypothetical protein [Pseudomonadota bacterium]
VAKADGEIVEVVTLDNRGLLICTDSTVYRFSADAAPIVAVGDRLLRGDQLVDVFQIFEINRGEVSGAIAALALDPG